MSAFPILARLHQEPLLGVLLMFGVSGLLVYLFAKDESRTQRIVLWAAFALFWGWCAFHGFMTDSDLNAGPYDLNQ